MLFAHDVDLVLDIGANTGQFAQLLRRAGYRGRMIFFEPLSRAHSELLRNSRGDLRWEIADRCAVGDYDGEIDLHIAGNSVSSSVLPMLQIHEDTALGSAPVGTERVPLRRLDSVAGVYLERCTVPFVKIDTQGFEDRVLNGAAGLLDRVIGLQLELSLVPLHGGQQRFIHWSIGFAIWAFRSGQYGRASTIRAAAVCFRLTRHSSGTS
jgi:FkbM family methyltransferase